MFNTAFWDALSIVNVTVDQKLEDGVTSVDKVGRWESSQFIDYSVPKPFTFTVGNNEVLRGAQDIISGEKYNNWNNLADVTNHHVFEITQTTPNQIISHFKSTVNATLDLNLLHGSAPQTAILELRDPWLIDFADPNINGEMRNRGMDEAVFTEDEDGTLPFEITTSKAHKGVFLDEEPDPGNPNIPHYAVRALSQQFDIKGELRFFDLESWSDNGGADITDASSDSTPVIFRSNNAIVTANMKGRRVSDTPNATRFNNAKKLTPSFQSPIPPGTFKPSLVYQDRNAIYRAQQQSDGQWIKDIQ